MKLINKRFFIIKDLDQSIWLLIFYTQLDGFVGFFTSHNCEMLMSHCDTPAPARHILILATGVHLNKQLIEL